MGDPLGRTITLDGQMWTVIHLPMFLDDDGDFLAVVESSDKETTRAIKRRLVDPGIDGDADDDLEF